MRRKNCRICGKEFPTDRNYRHVGSLCHECFDKKEKKHDELVDATLQISRELRKEFQRNTASSTKAMLDIRDDFFYTDPEKLTDDFIAKLMYKKDA